MEEEEEGEEEEGEEGREGAAMDGMEKAGQQAEGEDPVVREVDVFLAPRLDDSTQVGTLQRRCARGVQWRLQVQTRWHQGGGGGCGSSCRLSPSVRGC